MTRKNRLFSVSSCVFVDHHEYSAGVRGVRQQTGRAQCCARPANSATSELPATRTALLLEAVIAVHRLVAARQKRHFGLFAAVRAGHGVHFALAAEAAAPATAAAAAVAIAAITIPATAAVAVPIAVAAAASATALLARLPAGWATRGLISEALLCVELLLTRREHELRATIPARQRFVSVAHR